MLYKKKLISISLKNNTIIERTRKYHKAHDCISCDHFYNDMCIASDYLVCIFKDDGYLYLANRRFLCTTLGRSVFYTEDKITNAC